MITDPGVFEQLLIERKILEPEQLKNVRNRGQNNNMSIQHIITELGYASKEELLQVLAEAEGVEYVDLSTYKFEDENLPLLLGEKISRKFEMLALEKRDNTIIVAMKDPKNIFAIDSARLISSLEVQPVLVDPDELNKKINEFFSNKDEDINLKAIEVAAKSAPKPKKEQIVKSDNQSNVNVYGKKIGELLIEAGVINDIQLDTALEIQRREGGLLGSIMVKEGFLTKEQLYSVLEEENGIPYFELENAEIQENVVKYVSRKIAAQYKLIPVELENDVLKVAMCDPLNIYAIDDLRLATGLEIKPMFADVELIEQLIEKYYKQDVVEEIVEEEEEDITEEHPVDFDQEMEKVKEEIEIEVQKSEHAEQTIDISDVEDAPIVRMLNMILKNAVDKGASDIHIEAYEDCVMVRFRIDGQLVEIMKHDKKLQQILVARVKIISGLNIAEKRLPQDGRVSMKINRKNYDLRVSVLPTMFGEKVVIRIMDKDGFNKSKSELGFFEDDMQNFDHILSHPHGIVLVTGPTGSGKSTTLYTALRELSKPTVNIMTVEDPVECTIRGINQVQVNTKAGLTFANALRSFLRQDPDIIMVGEIRDSETAEIAIRAAITGHLVLSTIHTNDSVSTINRLVDMGIEPFLIASSLVGVLAQRLVRRLCVHCKEEYEPDDYEAKLLKTEDKAKIYKAVGCPACNNTGYKGRIAVYEILTITNELREMISHNKSTEELMQAALKNGMNTLFDSCSRLVKSGVTSLEEMMSVVSINENGEN